MNGVQALLDATRIHGDNVQAYRELGEIKATGKGDLILFSYTQACQYASNWNEIEQAARGLIVNWRTAELVALPFSKFFNLNERPETQADTLPDLPCEITTKLDGSLGIMYRDENNQVTIATRGAFDSEQAKWATHFARSQYPNLSLVRHDLTLLFEIIYPENRVVLSYGDTRALYLIGARHMPTGDELTHNELCDLANFCGVPVVPMDSASCLADLLPHVATLQGVEGWVLRFANGLRVKVKTEDYRALHRLVTGLSPRRVQEAMILNELDALLIALPEEFRLEAETMAANILARVESVERTVQAAYADTIENSGYVQNRKDFAIYATKHYRELTGYLFARLDGKDLRPMILKALDMREDDSRLHPRGLQ